MITNPFYVLILPLCTTLTAMGLAICWQWCKGQRDLLWMAGCFGLFSIGVTMQLLAVPEALDTNAVLSAALYHASVWCQAEAMNSRFGSQMYRKSAAVVGIFTLSLLAYYAYVDDQLYIRIWVLNVGLALQLTVATLGLWRTRTCNLLERWLRVLFGLFIVSFVLRTWLTMPQEEGLTAETFSMTAAWMAVQMCLLVFAMLFAMVYMALAIQQTIDQLHEERDRDSLTQLLNRRALFETVQKSPGAYASSVVMLCDIDHFKQINDQWGHAMGDLILQSVAKVLRECVRSSDLVVRYGGEEFVLLLPGIPMESAVQLANRIAKQLLHCSDQRIPRQLQITASFGLAETANTYDFHHAIELADQQLYAAKAAGRNRVHWQHAQACT